MKISIYLRVSTGHQTVENQLKQLEQFAESRSWEITETYQDEAISGDSTDRPAFERMIQDAKSGKFQCILVFQLSRLGRSMTQIVQTVSDLSAANVGIYSVSEHLSTMDDNPYTKVTLAIFAALAEVELSLIRERTRAGVERAKANGIRFGRPFASFDIGKAIKMRMGGFSLRKIAKALGIATSTLSARFAEMEGVQKVPATIGA